MWPSTTKGTFCRPGLFWNNEQNNVQNIKKIKGNTHFVKIVLSKISLQFWYHWKACSIFCWIMHKSQFFSTKVDKMYLLLYLVTYIQMDMLAATISKHNIELVISKRSFTIVTQFCTLYCFKTNIQMNMQVAATTDKIQHWWAGHFKTLHASSNF